MRILFLTLIMAGFLFPVGSAHALSYVGGSGRSDAMGFTGDAPYVTLLSAVPQSFLLGAAATDMSALTITQVLSSGDGVRAAQDIRVKIPALLNMTWDASVTTAVITGGAAGKVSTTVSYEDSNATLVLNVTADFVDGDTITVSGLKFNNFAFSGSNYLQLEIDNAGTAVEIDGVEKSISIAELSSGFLGGLGASDAMGYNGDTPYIVMASLAPQSFAVNAAVTDMSALTLTQFFSAADGIRAAQDIRVKIPALLNMTWDASVTTATITGGAAGKVSTTVAYEDSDTTLVLNVTADFVDGDTITVSGLKFKDFTLASSARYLQVEVDNAGTTVDVDVEAKDISLASRSTGFLGGLGRNDVLGPTGATPYVTLLSADSQSFLMGAAATDMNALTITQVLSSGDGVRAAQDIRVKIPPVFEVTWDTSVTTAVITGAASGKVSTTVSYEDSDATLVLNVTADFVDGDTITVSGLKFRNFTRVSANYLQLEVDNTGTTVDVDPFEKFILFVERSSGFLGGEGRSDVLGQTGATPYVTLVSTAPQFFAVGAAVTDMSALTISQLFSAADGIRAAQDIRVKIPPLLNMTWDTSVTTAIITGAASGKVSTTVSYEDSDATLIIDVTADFVDGETITVSGLKFKNFTLASANYLQVEVDNAGTTVDVDVGEKDISVASRSTGFMGGLGRNDVLTQTGATPYVTLVSAAPQSFMVAAAATNMSPLTIAQVFSSGDGIRAAQDIRVKIPTLLNMTWDASVTTAVITGGAAGKVSTTVSYEDSDATLVLNVTADFVDQDTITVSGLKFNNFTAAGFNFLQVEVDNAGTTADADVLEKYINIVERSAGFLGGFGRMEIEANIRNHAPNALMFGIGF